MGNAATITSANFDSEVLRADEPVLVDFYAPWCGPCLRMASELEALTDEFEGKVKVVKVNVDEDAAIAERFGVMGIPNLLLFRDGQPIDRILGMVPRELISKAINHHLAV